MHLLEAFLSWAAIDPAGPWLGHAADIVRLFRERFVDPVGGVLYEHFDEAWRRAPGSPGRSLEPGHHFEWVWLLSEYRKRSGDDSVLESARRLYGFAMNNGVDLDGLAFDIVGPDGSVIADTKLLWPQTEKLKAHLAMYEWTGAKEALEAARLLLRTIERRYLRDDLSFVNQLDRRGGALRAPTPSRVLYHLFLALAEADRVAPGDILRPDDTGAPD